MLPSIAVPRIWPAFWADVLRDRLQFFRLLCLMLAVLTLAGVTVALVFAGAGASPARALSTVAAGALLPALWIHGYRTRGLDGSWLPVEVALLLVLSHGLHNQFATFGVMYTALQYRATFGTRRDATTLAFVYAATLVTGSLLLPGDIGGLRPIVVVKLSAGAFNAYLMHTLSEVLSRDQQRSNDLRRSEDRYKALFHNNPYPMWEVDPASLKFLDVNAAAVELYGYSRAEFLGMTNRDLRAPDDIAAPEPVRRDLESDGRFTHHARHRTKTGATIEVEITSEMLDLGERRGWVGIAVNVSDRQRAERALRDSEQRFRSVAENLREALMITDAEDRIVLANARVREVLGYEPDEVLGRSASALLLPPSRQDVFRQRLLDRLKGVSEIYETELTRKDGGRIFAQISASPYRDASGRIIGTLGAISDVTDVKRLEDRLRQAMRMEAVGQLAGGVAHDFNNLLTVIKCHTELMLGETTKEGPARESVAEIARAANRGATLTQQLLAFSRKQLLRPRRVTLSDLVLEAEPMLRRIIGPKVELRVTSDSSAAEAYADPLQLEAAIATLVRNANDAMPTGGRVTIDTRVRVLEDGNPVAKIQEMPTGPYATISVADTGRGMTGDVVARLFEPFFTTKEVGEGTGLGLASLYGIVRQSGGFVDVQSEPRAGTTFRIYLPLSVSPSVGALPSTPALQRA